MIRFVKRLWSAAPLATLVLALALVGAGVFGGRTVAAWLYWRDPARQEQPIAGWMTPRYIAHSWDVPREVMETALGDLGPLSGGPRPLARLAADQGVPLEVLITRLETAIAVYRAEAPQP